MANEIKWLKISGLFFISIIRTDERKIKFSLLFAFSFADFSHWKSIRSESLNLSMGYQGSSQISAFEMKMYYIHICILLAKRLNDIPFHVLLSLNMNNEHTFAVRLGFRTRTSNIRNGIDETRVCVCSLSTTNRQVIHSFYIFICRILHQFQQIKWKSKRDIIDSKPNKTKPNRNEMIVSWSMSVPI